MKRKWTQMYLAVLFLVASCYLASALKFHFERTWRAVCSSLNINCHWAQEGMNKYSWGSTPPRVQAGGKHLDPDAWGEHPEWFHVVQLYPGTLKVEMTNGVCGQLYRRGS